MPAFLTDLDVRLLTNDTSLDKRGTRKLLSDLIYRSDILGRTIVVPEGFVTDFASVPRVPVAFLLTGDSAHAAAVVHDFLYSTKIVDRKTADEVFYEACRLEEPVWRSWIMWLGVRLGGSTPYNQPNQPQPPEVTEVVPKLESEAP